MLKNTNINLIWNQAHFAVNYHSINYWLSKDNIISCMLANELEKSELKTVLENVDYFCGLYIKDKITRKK